MKESESSFQKKGYRNLALEVLRKNYKDAVTGIRRNDCCRFLKSRTCSDFCDMAGIDSKMYREAVRKACE